MELSKEVHGLLERIKKLTQQAQKNENCSNTPFNIPLNISYSNLDSFMTTQEVNCTLDDLIPVDNMDFSDNERWLYVSENSMVNPYTGDLNEWLHQDFHKSIDNNMSSLEIEPMKFDSKKCIDTRTFTRPKKRLSRPSLEQFADGYYTQSSSRTSSDSFHGSDSKSSMQSFSEDLSSDSNYSENVYAPGNVLNLSGTAPLHFKLSEPVYNTSFDRILATANDSIDSFQNMSPPSLMNSLCSSTFTTLMDSGYVNQDIVPNVINDTFVGTASENIVLNENDDPNVTYTTDHRSKNDDVCNKLSMNDTYNKKSLNKTSGHLNSSFTKLAEMDLNTTFQRNKSNISGTNTFTKRPKAGNLTYSFKASCPDINRTFQKNHDYSLDLTFQKLSDSQPNLTEDLKRTILNQSMELMHPSGDTYHSARSGSADSLDERSSSISNSSKGSGTKILNMGDLDTLAKVQEQRLQQAMSTPKQAKTRLLLMEGDVLSPIQNRMTEEDYLSDSDLSDTCVTARSGFSKHSSPSRTSKLESLIKPRAEMNVTRPLLNNPEVSQPSLRTVPTMIVKPMEVNRTMVYPNRAQSAQAPSALRPKLRVSGLPRPTTVSSTGIPRPTSRIPGPKTLRPPSSRPSQMLPPKTDWMDGCY